MSNEPLVSVLMTAYNREKYVAEAIESVLSSSYKNWELIIVDDQSKDATVEIASKYATLDERIKVYTNENNLGDYVNRNKAAKYAKGKYLKYLDSDDLIYPFGLATMVQAMEMYPDAALGISHYVINPANPYPNLMQPNVVAKLQFTTGGVINSGPTATIIRRKCFEETGGFSGKKYLGDTELWMKIAFKHPIVLLSPGLVWWREHDAQEIRFEQKDKEIAVERYKLLKQNIIDPATPISDDTRNLALKKLNRRFIKNLLSNSLKKPSALTMQLEALNKSKMRVVDILAAIFH